MRIYYVVFVAQLQEKYNEDIVALKNEARVMLTGATSTKLMILIDKLEKLGLAYNFESEIQEKLQQIYDCNEDHDDLFTTSLRFRLLRQHRYHVSCSMSLLTLDIFRFNFYETSVTTVRCRDSNIWSLFFYFLWYIIQILDLVNTQNDKDFNIPQWNEIY